MTNSSGNNARLLIGIIITITSITLILDRLVTEGMFLDGITYAAISRNLAIGKGDFWNLYYRNEWTFSEHPPLMFGIQSVFFRIFGEHYLTEKIYSFTIWVGSAGLIHALWNRSINKPHKFSSTIPILLWTLTPTITWAYTNNILDCTMAIFDLAAVTIIYKALSKVPHNKNAFFFIMGGICVFAAGFTKGPVGLFPIAVPMIYWLTFSGRNFNTAIKAAGQSMIIFITVALCYVLVYQLPGAKENISRYLNEQLIAALAGKREITGGGLGRLSLGIDLSLQLIVPAGIALILFIVAKTTKTKIDDHRDTHKQVMFFLLVGLAASLPIMLSVKQRTFYLVPSLPYYALAIAALIYPVYIALTNRLKTGSKTIRKFKIASIVVAAGLSVYLFSKVGQVGRNHEILKEVKYIGKRFPKGQTFGICAAADNNYEFLAYLQRYNRMGVNPVFYLEDYVLIDTRWCNNNIIPFIIDIGFERQEFDLENYVLFKKKYPLNIDFTLLNPVYRKEDK